MPPIQFQSVRTKSTPLQNGSRKSEFNEIKKTSSRSFFFFSCMNMYHLFLSSLSWILLSLSSSSSSWHFEPFFSLFFFFFLFFFFRTHSSTHSASLRLVCLLSRTNSPFSRSLSFLISFSSFRCLLSFCLLCSFCSLSLSLCLNASCHSIPFHPSLFPLCLSFSLSFSPFVHSFFTKQSTGIHRAKRPHSHPFSSTLPRSILPWQSLSHSLLPHTPC